MSLQLKLPYVLSNENHTKAQNDIEIDLSWSCRPTTIFFNRASVQKAHQNSNNMQAHLFASHLRQPGFKIECDSAERLIQLFVNASDGSQQIIEMMQPKSHRKSSTVIQGGSLKSEELSLIQTMCKSS